MGTDPYIGEIAMVAFNYAPPGWLPCDGRLLPVNEYTALYSLLGTMYGGDGRNNFALPDFRGRMPIGQGSGPGLTPRPQGLRSGEENVLLVEAQIPAHTHTIGSHNHPMPHTHGTGTHAHPMTHTHDMASHTHTNTHSHTVNASPSATTNNPQGNYPGVNTGMNVSVYGSSTGKTMNDGMIAENTSPTGGPSSNDTGGSSASSTGDATAGDTSLPDPLNTGDASGATGSTGGDYGHDNMPPFQCVNFIIATEGTYPPRQ